MQGCLVGWELRFVRLQKLEVMMLGRLGAKICKALEVGSKDAWSAGSQDPQCLIFLLSVAKSLRERLACLPRGRVSAVWFNLGKVDL